MIGEGEFSVTPEPDDGFAPFEPVDPEPERESASSTRRRSDPLDADEDAERRRRRARRRRTEPAAPPPSAASSVLLPTVVATIVASVVAALVAVFVAAFVVHSLDEIDGFDDAAYGIDEGASPPPSRGELGWTIRGVVTVDDGTEVIRYTIPDDAVLVRIRLEAETDVDAWARFGAVDDDGEWCFQGTGDTGIEEGELSRNDHGDFAAGPFVVWVSSLGAAEDVPYTLTVDVVRARVSGALSPGESVHRGATSPETGYRHVVSIVGAGEGDALRVDLIDAERDLDFFVGLDATVSAESAIAKAETPMAHESLVIDAETHPELFAEGAAVHVVVVDPSQLPHPARFGLVVTSGRQPPPSITALPELTSPSDPLQRAILTVVDVGLAESSGSGTVLNGRGVILTAWHVVETAGETGDGELDPIVIGVSTDPREIAHEAFRARVLRSAPELDLALLEVTSGLHGRPLPASYRLPACPIRRGWEPRIGEPLVTIGFPETGGPGSRVPVTYARGVVSGFDRGRDGGHFVKTDAFIASGSSGGAALDAAHHLVGVPLIKRAEVDGKQQMGYLLPIEQIPEAWWPLITESGE